MPTDRQTDAPSPSGRASDFDSDRLGSSPRGATIFFEPGRRHGKRVALSMLTARDCTEYDRHGPFVECSTPSGEIVRVRPAPSCDACGGTGQIKDWRGTGFPCRGCYGTGRVER